MQMQGKAQQQNLGALALNKMARRGVFKNYLPRLDRHTNPEEQ